MSSILTNTSALVALQTLKSTNVGLAKAQNEIATGLKVATAKDNSSSWSIASTMSSDVASYKKLGDALTSASAMVGQKAIPTTARKILRTCSGKFCGSMWIEVIPMAYRWTTHSPRTVAVRKYMLSGYGTPGAFHSTSKPGTSGSLMSDNTNGKKSIWSPAVAITAGA